MDITELESEALALPTKQRASLANRLLESLENLDPEEYERLWSQESLRRAVAADESGAERVSGAVVAERARALLR